jgi:hypothetical protein
MFKKILKIYIKFKKNRKFKNFIFFKFYNFFKKTKKKKNFINVDNNFKIKNSFSILIEIILLYYYYFNNLKNFNKNLKIKKLLNHNKLKKFYLNFLKNYLLIFKKNFFLNFFKFSNNLLKFFLKKYIYNKKLKKIK